MNLFKRYLGEGNQPDPMGLFRQWLHKKRDIYLYEMQGDCFDIGTHQGYEDVRKRYERT